MRSRLANRRALSRQAGFTLLEMLVVLVVLGFLMVGLAQGVRAGLALWDAQSRRIGETAELDAAGRTLRTLLSGIGPAPSGGIAGAASAPELKGTADGLAFVGDLPTGLGTTRRADITLELRQGRRKQSSVLSRTSPPSDGMPPWSRANSPEMTAPATAGHSVSGR